VGSGRPSTAILHYGEDHADEFKTRFADSDVAGLTAGFVRFDAGGFIGVRTGDLVNAVLAGLGLAEPEWHQRPTAVMSS
jgi:hypothetical protein